jgi:hypothetical protein
MNESKEETRNQRFIFKINKFNLTKMAKASSEDTWMSTFAPVTVGDIDETDETEREMLMILLHAPKRTSKEKKCQWALMVQYRDGDRNVRYVFQAANINGKVAAVRIDYLDAVRWTSNFLSRVDISPKVFVNLVRYNPINGRDYRMLEKDHRVWVVAQCKMINHEFHEKHSVWNKKDFERFDRLGERMARKAKRRAKKLKKTQKVNKFKQWAKLKKK